MPPLPVRSQSRLLAAWRFFFHTDQSAGHDRTNHIVYLALSLLFVLLPFAMELGPAKSALSLFGRWRLPSSCMTEQWFSSKCPGCGLTRSFVAVAYGQWRASLAYHRLGLLLYAFFVSQVGFRIYALCRLDRPLPRRVQSIQYILGMTMVAALLLNWGIGLFLG